MTHHHTRKKGGVAIASGGYGCVFSPALRCAGQSTRKNNHVSKLMLTRNAKEEHATIRAFHARLKSVPGHSRYFVLGGISVCRPAALSESDQHKIEQQCRRVFHRDKIDIADINLHLKHMTILSLPNKGIRVDEYLVAHPDQMHEVHAGLVGLLLSGIVPMNRKRIFHSDIKDSNVLVDAAGTPRLIDWGLAVDFPAPRASRRKHAGGGGTRRRNINRYKQTRRTTAIGAAPYNWSDRPLQFNVPFSQLLFTDMFSAMHKTFAKRTGNKRPTLAKATQFVNAYLRKWFAFRGDGHSEYVREIVTLVRGKGARMKPVVAAYLAHILVHFTTDAGVFQLDAYIETVYVTLVDVWGFLMIYLAFVEQIKGKLLRHPFATARILACIDTYLYTPRVTPIDMAALELDLRSLLVFV